MFNIFKNDVFFHMQKIDLCSYADDSTLYAAEKFISVLLDNLKKENDS